MKDLKKVKYFMVTLGVIATIAGIVSWGNTSRSVAGSCFLFVAVPYFITAYLAFPQKK